MRRTKAGEIAKVVLDNIAGIFDLNLGRGRNEAEERSATLPHGNLGPFRDDHDRGLRHNPTELHRTELCNAASQQPQPRSKIFKFLSRVWGTPEVDLDLGCVSLSLRHPN